MEVQVLSSACGRTASDPGAVSLSDDDLVQPAISDVSRVLGIATAPRLARIYRWLNAGAQHTVGHLDRIARLEERLRAHPGIVVAGSGFRSIGIPDCIADARATASAAAAFGH